MKEPAQSGDGNRFKSQYPIVVSNGSGETIPPYAVMQLAGATVVGTDRVFTVVKPTGLQTAEYVLNGPTAINQSGYGAATDQYPAIAAHGGVPVLNAEWGPVAGSWLLSPSGQGFLILGGSDGGRVHVAAKGGVSAGDDFPIVKIINTTGLPKPFGTIFGYGVPFDPPPATLYRIPTFVSAAPTAGKPFCVALDPVDNSQVVDCGPCGVVACLLDYTDEAHAKADCITGNYANLKSADEGPAIIIWREKQNIAGGGTFGVQWARVLLDREGKGAASDTIVVKIDGAISARNNTTRGSGTAQPVDPVTLADDGDEITIYNLTEYSYSGTPTGGGGPLMCLAHRVDNGDYFIDPTDLRSISEFDNNKYIGATGFTPIWREFNTASIDITASGQGVCADGGIDIDLDVDLVTQPSNNTIFVIPPT